MFELWERRSKSVKTGSKFREGKHCTVRKLILSRITGSRWHSRWRHCVRKDKRRFFAPMSPISRIPDFSAGRRICCSTEEPLRLQETHLLCPPSLEPIATKSSHAERTHLPRPKTPL